MYARPGRGILTYFLSDQWVDEVQCIIYTKENQQPKNLSIKRIKHDNKEVIQGPFVWKSK